MSSTPLAWLRAAGAITVAVVTIGREAHALDCGAVAAALAGRVQDLRCVDSPDLTTQNPETTPADNSRPDLPPLAFTPRSDRAALIADAQRPPIARAVPGLQITGAMADDEGARFVLRLPATGFSGRLVVGVPAATRSEHTGDYFLSDLVLQRGDAYVMSNKGAYNLRPTTASDPLGCALAPPGVPAAATFVHSYFSDAPRGIEAWFQRTAEAAELARDAAVAAYGARPRRSYLFGVSAGALTVRHLLAFGARGFDGGVDWEGLYVTPRHPTFLREYPQGVAAYLDYRSSGYDPGSAGAAALLGLGFAPDLFAQPPTPQNGASPIVGSYWETAANSLWGLFGCILVKRLDPTYAGDLAAYDVDARRAESLARAWQINMALARIATPGAIERPLITVSGTIDQLAPIDAHARAFRRDVVRSGRGRLHRLYEVQNGGHLDRLRDGANFTQLEPVAPHALRALDLLEQWVEKGAAPPAGQCIPRGGAIVADPRAERRPEHCAALVAP
jgi:hypothetical protein